METEKKSESARAPMFQWLREEEAVAGSGPGTVTYWGELSPYGEPEVES